MENKKTYLTLVLCLLLVIAGTIINKAVFGSEDTEVDKGKYYNELVSRGYTEVDLNNKKEFHKGYKILTNKDKDYNNTNVKLIINEDISYFESDKQYEIVIKNIKDYYIEMNSDVIYLYLITKDNKIYFSYYRFINKEDIDDIIINLNNSFSEITNDKNIDSFKKLITITKYRDGSTNEYLIGCTLNNQEYYIDKGSILDKVSDKYFDIVYFFNEDVYVSDDNILKINDQNLFNVKYILSNYFVSVDNKLYKIDNHNITLEDNKVIKYMFYYEYDDIFKLAFIFDDDEVKHIDLIVKDYKYEIQGFNIESEK